MPPDSGYKVVVKALGEDVAGMDRRLHKVETEVDDLKDSVKKVVEWMNQTIGRSSWADKVVNAAVTAVVVYMVTKTLK